MSGQFYSLNIIDLILIRPGRVVGVTFYETFSVVQPTAVIRYYSL